jgi:hypothetical protein
MKPKNIEKHPQTKGFPTYPTIGACSGATGVPVSVLRRDKRAGCPAFAGSSRVDSGLWLRWHFSQSEEASILLDPSQEKAKLDESKRLAQEMENAVTVGQLQKRETIEREVWELGLLPLRQAIEAMPGSLASQCNPDNPKLAQTVLEGWKEQTKKQIKARVK